MSPNPPPEGPIHPLDVIRAQRGWTYRDLAKLVAAHARELGFRNMAAERQKVWRWAHRGVKPDRIAQVALASAIGIPLAQAEATPWPGWLLTAVDIPAPAPVTVDDIAVAARRLAGLRGIDSNSPTLRRALAEVLRVDRQRLAARPPLAPCGTDGHPAGCLCHGRPMVCPQCHHGDDAHGRLGCWHAGEDGSGCECETSRAAILTGNATPPGASTPAEVDVCPECRHTDVAHQSEGCAVLGCACPRTYVELLADRAGEALVRRLEQSPPPVDNPDGYARTMPIPVVHVSAGGTRTCHCEHLVIKHGAPLGCLECACEWTFAVFDTAKVITDGADGSASL